MNGLIATGVRVIRQLKHDKRSIAMMLVLPIFLISLLKWILNSRVETFNVIGPQLLGIFPLVIMFLVTAITMVRERTNGTLERILTTPVTKLDIIGGYGVAFGVMASIQALLLSTFAIFVLGLETSSNPIFLIFVALIDALLGTALGLAISALANTEFQAVQFMPVILFPQLLLCGFITPRDQLPAILHFVSGFLPLSYAIDAINELVSNGATHRYWFSLVILKLIVIASLIIGATTLKRKTK